MVLIFEMLCKSTKTLSTITSDDCSEADFQAKYDFLMTTGGHSNILNFNSGKRIAICTFVPLIKKLIQAVTKKILIWEERSNTEEHPKKNVGIKCREHFQN
jgi:hypothetical protein